MHLLDNGSKPAPYVILYEWNSKKKEKKKVETKNVCMYMYIYMYNLCIIEHESKWTDGEWKQKKAPWKWT